MKDKLVKFGHKRPYYTARKLMIAFAAFIGLAAVSATPIAIAYGVEMAPKAGEVQVEEASSEAEEASMTSILSSIED